MSKPGIDIIVPVWNKPLQTRSCLVNLIAHSADFRLILISNGSDRETENLLEEFAEQLDDRALLISSAVNLGFVRAVNIGLARVEAEFAAVVRNTSLVPDRWLDPIIALAHSRPEAGVIVPRLAPVPVRKRRYRSNPPVVTIEVSHGDFAATVLRKSLYDRIGGFDEGMDDGFWCLKDYSRRALKAGFLTFAAEGKPVLYSEDTPLGAAARREDRLRRSIDGFTAQWGEESAFCIYFPREVDVDLLRQKLDILLEGARQGHSFTLLVFQPAYKELVRSGYGSLHRNIRIEKLPRLFTDRSAERLEASLRAEAPMLRTVAGVEGCRFPGSVESIPFAEVEQLVRRAEAEKYGR